MYEKIESACCTFWREPGRQRGRGDGRFGLYKGAGKRVKGMTLTICAGVIRLSLKEKKTGGQGWERMKGAVPPEPENTSPSLTKMNYFDDLRKREKKVPCGFTQEVTSKKLINHGMDKTEGGEPKITRHLTKRKSV